MRSICSTSTISRIHQQWCFSYCMNTTGISEHGSLNSMCFLLWRSSHSSLFLLKDSMLVFLDYMTWIMWVKSSTVLMYPIISNWSVSCGLPELDLSVCFYDSAQYNGDPFFEFSVFYLLKIVICPIVTFVYSLFPPFIHSLWHQFRVLWVSSLIHH